MSLIISFFTFLTFQTAVQSLSGTAELTWYISYAPCCPDNPNYDPNADTTECVQYSACSYSGDFWALGIKSFDYVKTTNLVAFFNPSDPNGDNFMSNYGGKEITLSKNGITFTAIIADSCGDSDCGGCCTTNSQPSGFLVDMEYWTAINNFGSTDDMYGQIQFTIGDTVSTSTSTTTTSTDTPANGNIIIRNQASTELYWVAFFISNIDLTCGGSITNVEITDNNHYSGTWVASDDNQWGYYSFPNDGNAFVEPISVRITKRYNTVSESIVANDLISLSGGQTFDFGSNFCVTTTPAPTTTTTTTINPTPGTSVTLYSTNLLSNDDNNYDSVVDSKGDSVIELLIGSIISLGLIILIIVIVICVCKRRQKQLYENQKFDNNPGMIFASTLKIEKTDDVLDGEVNTEIQTNIIASIENDYDNEGLFID